MKLAVILLVLAILISIAPAQAVDSSLQQVAGTVVSTMTTDKDKVGVKSASAIQDFKVQWVAPSFRFKCKERIFIQVISSGGSYGGSSASEWASWLQLANTAELTKIQIGGNFTILKGTPQDGDLVYRSHLRVASGREMRRDSSSGSSGSSGSRKGRTYSEASSGTISDGYVDTGMYMTVRTELVRVCKGGEEIVVAPSGRISKSDSSRISGSEYDSSAESHSQTGRRGSYESYTSSTESSSWNRGETMEQEMMGDDTVQYLSRGSITLLGNALIERDAQEKYWAKKAAEAAKK